ncbi:uncharacterized protein LOC133545391 isoform X6 [Nerophis ophidion]|uniref:uncharacterized protein LOC133545391 isoform X6 n=1 Tax=Nerophis ophidion TaxID=159077 RepID=UPI002ADF3CFF|nr:uncharacterized protein LOC133545391 isoform X6 [Nerophis ophidion]
MCERTIAKYEEEICPTKEEKEQQHQLLDAVFKKHQIVLHKTDLQQPPHIKEEEVDPQPPHIKEEDEEVWITQEEECLLGQEEADLSKFPLTVVSVKTEEHEDKPPESSQLHHSPKRHYQCLPRDMFKVLPEVGIETLSDRRLCQTFPANPHNASGTARSVQHPPPPSQPSHHQVVIGRKLRPSLHPSV